MSQKPPEGGIVVSADEVRRQRAVQQALNAMNKPQLIAKIKELATALANTNQFVQAIAPSVQALKGVTPEALALAQAVSRLMAANSLTIPEPGLANAIICVGSAQTALNAVQGPIDRRADQRPPTADEIRAERQNRLVEAATYVLAALCCLDAPGAAEVAARQADAEAAAERDAGAAEEGIT